MVARSLASMPSRFVFVRVTLALLAVFLCVGGCGSGGTSSAQQGFFLQAIGPEGGSAEAGPVHLMFPPGALVQNTTVDIMPEPVPLPIQPPPFDPCLYSYVGPVHCCGPNALQLAVDAVLRVGYDESLIPAGFSENDLVLLISDNVNDVMVPKTGASVTQNTLLNFFEDTAYGELGHVGIGLRACPQGRILVQNNPAQPAAKPATGTTQGIQAPQLYIVDPSEVPGPALVDTSGLGFGSFLASPSGDHVLLLAANDAKQGSGIFTVPLPLGGAPVEVFADDFSTSLFMQAYDPFFGWLKGSEVDEAFVVVFRGTGSVQAQGTVTPPPTDTYDLMRRDASALAPEVLMHQHDASFYYPDDLRQSDDGASAMLRWGPSFGGDLEVPAGLSFGGLVDVLDSPAGTVVSEGAIQPNLNSSSPRFMTLDDDLYVINNAAHVERWQPDGTLVGTLFDPGFESGELLRDFALAPDDETFAMVVEVQVFLAGFQQGFSTPETELWMGTLTDGVLATFSYFSQQFVDELVWHPQQTGVFLDLSGVLAAFYELRNDKGDYISETVLPVDGMQNLDVNRVDGRILVLAGTSAPRLTTAATLPQGLYVSPSDASDFQPVSMPGLSNPVQARWIESWRNQPGMSSARVR